MNRSLVVLSALPMLATQDHRIPFMQGVIVTWAAQEKYGDFEVRVELTRSDTVGSQLRVSWTSPTTHQLRSFERQVLRQARLSARAMSADVYSGDTTNYAGVSSYMTSAAILEELKRTGRARVEFLLPAFAATRYSGVITRVGSGPTPFSVIVNGDRVALPAVRATGRLLNNTAATGVVPVNVVFLDDASAAWMLHIDVTRPDGVRATRDVVRISYPRTGRELEAELSTRCRATTYDIYFATASAELEPASAPTLKSIARAMSDHSDWKVTIVGHTDSIGTAEYNRDLSLRRAGSVRGALARDYGIAAARLQADGRGESQPVEDNGTLPGRARNRRVELVRECK
jgi:outer membrane protein OmpA-like peptidoglycan-associated protein